MTLHATALRLLTRYVANRRPPDVVIGGEAAPYMRRWWVIPRNRVFNIYLHHFLRSDDDRALHDHPWVNMSWLLDGSYLEIVPIDITDPSGPTRACFRTAGDFAIRKSESAHRIVLMVQPNSPNPARPIEKPVWTLFVTGPKVRDWGFWCPKGWKDWRDFTAFRSKGNGHEVGPGCGEP